MSKEQEDAQKEVDRLMDEIKELKGKDRSSRRHLEKSLEELPFKRNRTGLGFRELRLKCRKLWTKDYIEAIERALPWVAWPKRP